MSEASDGPSYGVGVPSDIGVVAIADMHGVRSTVKLAAVLDKQARLLTPSIRGRCVGQSKRRPIEPNGLCVQLGRSQVAHHRSHRLRKSAMLGSMDDAYRVRAAARRQTMVGGVAKTFAELEECGLEFWQSAAPADRLRAMAQLHVDAWILGGKRGDPPRFDGSTWGVMRFESELPDSERVSGIVPQ